MERAIRVSIIRVARKRTHLHRDVRKLGEREQLIEITEGFFVFLSHRKRQVAEDQLQAGMSFGDALEVVQRFVFDVRHDRHVRFLAAFP